MPQSSNPKGTRQLRQIVPPTCYSKTAKAFLNHMWYIQPLPTPTVESRNEEWRHIGGDRVARSTFSRLHILELYCTCTTKTSHTYSCIENIKNPLTTRTPCEHRSTAPALPNWQRVRPQSTSIHPEKRKKINSTFVSAH